MADERGPQAQTRALGVAARREVAAACTYARGLDAAAWDAPSWCDGWSVREVLAHLAEGTERFALQTRAGLAGEPVPEYSIEARNERRAKVKAQAPTEMLAALTRHNDAFFDDLEARDDAALSVGVLPLAGRSLTGVQVAQLRLNEFMLHRWDVVALAHPAAALDAESAALALDFNLANAPRMAKAPALEGLAVTYLCDASGPGGGPVTIGCAGGAATVARGAPEHADVTLRLAVETLIRLIWGRVAMDRALADGTIQVDGDRGAVAALGRAFGNR